MPDEQRNDPLMSVAAVALLATAALDARRRPDHSENGTAEAARDAQVTRVDDATAVVGHGGLKGKVDAFQVSHPVLAFPIGVVRKFGDDRGGRLAAVISYYSFFSIFPALLAMTTILGFILDNNEDLAKDISDSALAQFPVVGPQLANNSQPLTGSALALVVGIVGAVWAGLGAAQASQDAMNTIWNVPRVDQPSFFPKRLRSVAALILIGLLFAANAVLPNLPGAPSSGVLSKVLVIGGAVIVDALVFAVMFKLLTARRLAWGELSIGAIVASVGYVILQNVGAIYLDHVVRGAQNTYGTFAGVIGLLTWMFLLGQWFILSATVNVVRILKLWPRSLFRPPSTRADRRSQRGKLDEAKLTEHVEVDVTFNQPT